MLWPIFESLFSYKSNRGHSFEKNNFEKNAFKVKV